MPCGLGTRHPPIPQYPFGFFAIRAAISLPGERRPEEGTVEIERVESLARAEVVGNVAPAAEQVQAVAAGDTGQSLPF